MIFSQSYENRLAASFLGQKKHAGCKIGMHGYGVGPLEIIDCQPKCFPDTVALFKIFFNSDGNDFSVRGYVAVDRISI